MVTKQLYLDRVEAQLKTWASEFEGLWKRAEEDSVAAEHTLLRWVQRQKRNEVLLRHRLEDVVTVGRASVADLAAGLRRAWIDLRAVVGKAAAPLQVGARRPRRMARRPAGHRPSRARPAAVARG